MGGHTWIVQSSSMSVLCCVAWTSMGIQQLCGATYGGVTVLTGPNWGAGWGGGGRGARCHVGSAWL